MSKISWRESAADFALRGTAPPAGTARRRPALKHQGEKHGPLLAGPTRTPGKRPRASEGRPGRPPPEVVAPPTRGPRGPLPAVYLHRHHPERRPRRRPPHAPRGSR